MIPSILVSLFGFVLTIRTIFLDNQIWLTTSDYFCHVRHCDFLGIKFMYWGIFNYFLTMVLALSFFHKTIILFSFWWLGLNLYFFYRLYKKKDVCYICVLTIATFVVLIVDNSLVFWDIYL